MGWPGGGYPVAEALATVSFPSSQLYHEQYLQTWLRLCTLPPFVVVSVPCCCNSMGTRLCKLDHVHVSMEIIHDERSLILQLPKQDPPCTSVRHDWRWRYANYMLHQPTALASEKLCAVQSWSRPEGARAINCFLPISVPAVTRPSSVRVTFEEKKR